MFWKCHQITRIRILKCGQRHLLFCGELYGRIIDRFDTINALCSLLGKAVIAHTLKYIVHHGSIANDWRCQTQCRIYDIICRDLLAIRPGCILIDMHDKIFVIFRRNRIRDFSLKFQIRI